MKLNLLRQITQPKDCTMTALGTLLRETRQSLDKTLDDMAKEVGVNKGVLSRIETGRIDCSPKWVEKISLAYGVDVAKFQPERLADKSLNPHLDENIVNLVGMVAKLNLKCFTLRDFYFLMKMEKVLGRQLHINLIRELLLTRNKSR